MKKARVLVADDNGVDRLLLSSIVESHGYEVVTADDGLQALAVFESAHPDIVMLDVLMPGQDGFDVARGIRERHRERFVPIIFLTSLTEATALARCVESGGDDFLSKPYNRIIIGAKLEAFDRMRQMHITLRDQRDEIAQHNSHLVHEQEAAKAVFDNVAHSGALEIDNVRHLLSPLAVFNGDVLLAARNPAGGLYVLLGDFTGHGLPAAIGAMPVAEIFYAMASKGFLLQDIVRECNTKLNKMLPPGYFCCATVLDMNFKKGTLEAWTGGLPAGLIARIDGGEIDHLDSIHLPLGIRDESKFDDSTLVVPMEPGDRVLLCTDGVLEARNRDDEMFGSQRLDRIVGDRKRSLGVFDAVVEEIYKHMNGQVRDDDITLVEVTMVDEAALAPAAAGSGGNVVPGPVDWQFSYELGPESLKGLNPLPLLQHILMDVPPLRRRGSAIYTTLAELYSNALEHGVLGLNSLEKRTPLGFATYYAKRAEALEALDTGFVRFEFENRRVDDKIIFVIRVIDSGKGFDYAAARDCEANPVSYHGRGLRLLRELCSELEFHGCGNRVEASFEWSDR